LFGAIARPGRSCASALDLTPLTDCGGPKPTRRLLSGYIGVVAALRNKITLGFSGVAFSCPGMDDVASPCTGICRLDSVGETCLGCRRAVLARLALASGDAGRR